MGTGIGKGGRKNIQEALARGGNALDRMQRLEQDLAQIVKAVNSVNENFVEKINLLEEVLNSVGEIIGAEKIKEVLADRALRRAVNKANADKEAVAKALAEGKIVVDAVVTEKSFIVGREVDSEGKELPPGRIQLQIGDVEKTFQDQLMSKPVGTTIDTPIGGKFELQEIYSIAPVAAVDSASALAQ